MYYSVGWTCWTCGCGGGDTLRATLFAGGDALDALGTLLAGGAGDDATCMLEAVEGERCVPEVLEAMRAALYTGGRETNIK